jgi:hypothetical protein
MISFPKSDDGVCCRAPATHPVNRRVHLLRPAAAIYVRSSSTFGRKSIEKYCKYISRRKTHVATARRSDYVNNSITSPPPQKKITRRDIEMTYRHIFYL